jgi:hypothetical protein
MTEFVRSSPLGQLALTTSTPTRTEVTESKKKSEAPAKKDTAERETFESPSANLFSSSSPKLARKDSEELPTMQLSSGQSVPSNVLNFMSVSRATPMGPATLGPELYEALSLPKSGLSHKAQRTAVADALNRLGYKQVKSSDVTIEFASQVVKGAGAKSFAIPDAVREAMGRPAPPPGPVPYGTAKKHKEKKPAPQPSSTPLESAKPTAVSAVASFSSSASATQLLELGQKVLSLPAVGMHSPPTNVAKQIAGAHMKLLKELRACSKGSLSEDLASRLTKLDQMLDANIRSIASKRTDFDFANCETAYIDVQTQVDRAVEYATHGGPKPSSSALSLSDKDKQTATDS